jgi:hypothetical protein
MEWLGDPSCIIVLRLVVPRFNGFRLGFPFFSVLGPAAVLLSLFLRITVPNRRKPLMPDFLGAGGSSA